MMNKTRMVHRITSNDPFAHIILEKNISEIRAIIGPKPFPKTMASQPTLFSYPPPQIRVYHWFP